MSKKDRVRRAGLMAFCAAVAVSVVALLMCSGNEGFNADAAKSYILQNHIADTAAGNAVAAVYLNYRFWDTLFESLMLVACVVAVISLSWSGSTKDGEDG